MERLQYRKENDLIIVYDEIQVGDIYLIGIHHWRVLHKEDKKALLICEESIHLRNYDYQPTTYENSPIREYINHNFLYYDLRCDFIPLIMKTEIIHENGHVTYDRMFLLSEEEVQRYFKDESSRKTNVKHSRKYEPWWLRTKENMKSASYVDSSGKIAHNASTSCLFGCRPAFYMKLDEKINWIQLNESSDLY